MNKLLAFLMSIGAGFCVFYGIGSMVYYVTDSKDLAWIFGLPLGLIIMPLSYRFLCIERQRKITWLISRTFHFIRAHKEKIINESMELDAALYAIADEELVDGNIDKGLWAIALVYSEGNEEKRRSEYIKLRVNQLKEK